MEAKITCVYDEGAQENTSYIGAKGTAFIIDAGGKRILFDTGLRHKYLLHNLEYLEIPVDSIDAVVVSQAHPDNSRALNGFLAERADPVDVYCTDGIYGTKSGFFSSSVGIDEDNRSKAVFHNLSGWTEIVPGLFITPMIQDASGYSEAYAVIEGNGLTLISGRGNLGPQNALDAVASKFGGRKVRTFIGSLNLEKAKKHVGQGYAQQLQDAGVTDIYLNHCTGRDGMTQVRVVLGLRGASDFYVGDVVSLK